MFSSHVAIAFESLDEPFDSFRFGHFPSLPSQGFFLRLWLLFHNVSNLSDEENLLKEPKERRYRLKNRWQRLSYPVLGRIVCRWESIGHGVLFSRKGRFAGLEQPNETLSGATNPATRLSLLPLPSKTKDLPIPRHKGVGRVHVQVTQSTTAC